MFGGAAWTTADYALIVGVSSSLIAVGGLIWNIWSKYIFVKPNLQVAFTVMVVLAPKPGTRDVLTSAGTPRLFILSATNMGPGPLILYTCIAERKRDWTDWWLWRRRPLVLLNPIHDDPRNPLPRSLGPFSGGLPLKIDAGEIKSFYFPFTKEGVLEDPRTVRVGMSDTYGRRIWCRIGSSTASCRAQIS